MTVSVAGNTFWIFEGAARFGAPGAAATAMSHGQRARERACAPARSRCPQRLKRTRAQSLRLWSGGWRRSRPAAARLSERSLRRRGFGEAKDGAHRLIAARARRDGGAEVLSRSLRGWAAVKADVMEVRAVRQRAPPAPRFELAGLAETDVGTKTTAFIVGRPHRSVSATEPW